MKELINQRVDIVFLVGRDQINFTNAEVVDVTDIHIVIRDERTRKIKYFKKQDVIEVTVND